MPKGFTIWFTGLSGSGKSTLANEVARRIAEAGRLVTLLDGDVVRQHLSKGLGFSKDDRDTNIRRIGFVAYLITQHGGIAISAAISPYRSIRAENRKLIGNFVEVYCACPLEACEGRDVKGLYAKARKAVADGKPMGFTGVDDPYEEPENPEITVHTGEASIAACTEQIIQALRDQGFLGAEAQGAKRGFDHHEYVPEELVKKAEDALRKAGRVHTEILLRELHVGLDTAARIMDRLAEKGIVGLSGPS